MNRVKKYIIFTITIFIFLSIVFFYGKYQGKKTLQTSEKQITSQIILERIKNQYFLVTKTLFYNDKINIKISKDSSWRDILWGETIIANGLVRIDIGVNVNNLKSDDIIIDKKNKEILVYLPTAEILDSSLSGDLDIKTKKGLFANLKSLINSNEGEDYNRAVRELVEQAKYRASQNQELFNSARNDAISLLRVILNDLNPNYTIKIDNKSE